MVKVKPEVNTVTFRHEEPVKIDDSKVNKVFLEAIQVDFKYGGYDFWRFGSWLLFYLIRIRRFSSQKYLQYFMQYLYFELWYG